LDGEAPAFVGAFKLEDEEAAVVGDAGGGGLGEGRFVEATFHLEVEGGRRGPGRRRLEDEEIVLEGLAVEGVRERPEVEGGVGRGTRGRWGGRGGRTGRRPATGRGAPGAPARKGRGRRGGWRGVAGGGGGGGEGARGGSGRPGGGIAAADCRGWWGRAAAVHE